MSVLLLVRHGQASFGARNYDELSDRGRAQGRLLGGALAAHGIQPDRVMHGGMNRHQQTVEALVDSAGWSMAATIDVGWAEFDHQQVIAAHRPAYRRPTVMKADLVRTLKPHRAFQKMFLEATSRWSSGDHDDDYSETFVAFGNRIDAALRRAVEGEGTTLVVTSAGCIGLIASRLITDSAQAWSRLNMVTVNTSTTKVIAGEQAPTLVSFNNHSHLEHDPDMITYR
ncbi:histidine phosphatase family protein [Leekyejoonella antrihumi]|uniref:Histidine phosphatase family protein n=1 Tax=Leekyejoonella antrihumi TaxID=1660198 RepID=A0A563DYA9_9MICO|nr:histidine phosphatase family protein [Leekyejoonella antrihumi]TWP35217.1 histidine phosphatase family protein [Leekyejoonella antrihumi]